ncbi:MAG: prefoldin subunit alpha [Candidatus Bathyarchaeia archaeon]|nr:prefoldin subunit alpha [Candidatus Bathyarchaeota archaeon A05DMB-4]MDH7595359.1 prefoldin subunit alpha [Candidatus Bathyarchaeota archaeon]
MTSEEEAFRQLAVELRILENTAENLESRINFVNAAITELTYARMTLEGLEKEKADSSLFVPIGGGSYIKARLESPDKVIVGVGSGVAVEKTFAEAKEKIKSRIEEMEKARTSMEQQLSQMLERIREDRTKLQEISVKLSRRERGTNVRETKSGS